MKITIELTEAQVKGIKEYLKESSDIEKPSKSDVVTEVKGILDTYFQSQHSALTDYIQKYS